MKWEVIKRFSAENKSCFSYKDVIAEYPDKDHSYLTKVLAAMVRSGMLMKLSRDVYHIIPLSADPLTYSPDSRLVANKENILFIPFGATVIDEATKRSRLNSQLETASSILVLCILESLLLDTCFFTSQVAEVENTCSSNASVFIDVYLFNKW